MDTQKNRKPDAQGEVKELLADLNLDNLPEQEKQKALVMLSERYQNVVLDTMIMMATPEQKLQIQEALKDPKTAEEKITRITAEIPGFAEALEDAFLKEHEFLKTVMSRKNNKV